MSWDDIQDPSPDFVERVLAIVGTIPSGMVMAYGDVADAIGEHPDLTDTIPAYGARLVGRVMSRFGGDVAWWRVLRASGQPPKFHEAEAWSHYLAEGTPLTGSEENYRIDMKQARFVPGEETSRQATLGFF
jgi:alkylated DNA nucleotide flippase Atl1